MTLNRRVFAGSLAAIVTSLALPVADAVAGTEIAPAASLSLTTVRDVLLPALRGITKDYGKDYESDIFVNFKADTLVVKAYKFSTKQQLGFAISRSSIDSGIYKAAFRPSLIHLFKKLSGELS